MPKYVYFYIPFYFREKVCTGEMQIRQGTKGTQMTEVWEEMQEGRDSWLFGGHGSLHELAENKGPTPLKPIQSLTNLRCKGKGFFGAQKAVP